MAIHRFAPGEPVPRPGRYALVGHYGEALNFSREVRKGEQLPFVLVTSADPVWFVRVDEADSGAQAA